MTREQVYSRIDAERRYQDTKWGPIHEHGHEVGGWICLLEKLLGEARAAWASNHGDHAALHELRKVVAVGVACLEQHSCPSRV